MDNGRIPPIAVLVAGLWAIGIVVLIGLLAHMVSTGERLADECQDTCAPTRGELHRSACYCNASWRTP